MAIPEWVVYLIVIFPPLLGMIWIYGTWKNWEVLMDPSDVLWFMWLWHWARKNMDDEGMKTLNYITGITLLLSGIIFSFPLFLRINNF